jgi:dGTPase
MKNEEQILSGEFQYGLLDVSSYKAQIADIISISVKKVYQSTEVVNKEIAGYSVLDGLLSVYVKAAVNTFDDKCSNYDKLILKALPETVVLSNQSLYQNSMAICLYISKLSDSNAMLLFHRLNGNSI